LSGILSIESSETVKNGNSNWSVIKNETGNENFFVCERTFWRIGKSSRKYRKTKLCEKNVWTKETAENIWFA